MDKIVLKLNSCFEKREIFRRWRQFINDFDKKIWHERECCFDDKLNIQSDAK